MNNTLKPGTKTTEFWGKVLVQFLTIIAMFIPDAGVEPEKGITIVAVLEMVYNLGRSIVKAFAEKWKKATPVSAVAIFLIAALALGSFAACSGNQITKAYNTLSVVQSGYNAGGPILKSIPWTEQQKPIVEAADLALHDAIAAGWATLIAVKSGEQDPDQIKVAFHAVLAALGELSQLVDNETFQKVVKGIQTALEFYLEINPQDAHYFQEFQTELAVMASGGGR